MSRDRHHPDRRPYRLVIPAGCRRARARETLGEDVAPWVIASVRAWPRSVEGRLVAVRIGVPLHLVQLARRTRP